MNKEIEELLNTFKELINTYSPDTEPFTIDYDYEIKYSALENLLSYIEQLEQCYCNRTDCSSRIKDSKKYDSLLQKYEQLEKENENLKQKHYLIEGGRGNLKSYTLKLEKENKQLQKEKDIAEYNYNSLHGAVVEIARELEIKEPEFTNTEIIIDNINQLQNDRDKAIEYANNCLNNINDCVKNGNYTIKELTSWVPTLQCVHNSYLKILKGDSDE